MILISILRLSSYLQSLQLPKQSTSIPWKPVDNQPYSAEKEKLLKRTTCKKLGVLQLLSQCAWLQVFQGSYCLHCCHWVDCWLIQFPLLRWLTGSSFCLCCQHLVIVTAVASMPLSHCCSCIIAPLLLPQLLCCCHTIESLLPLPCHLINVSIMSSFCIVAAVIVADALLLPLHPCCCCCCHHHCIIVVAHGVVITCIAVIIVEVVTVFLPTSLLTLARFVVVAVAVFAIVIIV